jgi:hypothetical protein
MKVYINKYKNHWTSPYTICEKICFWREINYDEPWVKRTNAVLEPIMTFIMKLRQFFDRKIDYVKIDGWDTWSLDHTLALIILPALKQLKEQKHGYPLVADEDAPEEIRSYKCQVIIDDMSTGWDDFAEQRWDYVLDEMIFAFEHLVDDKWEEEFWTGEHGVGDTFEEMMNNSTRKWDREGQQLVENRINNGLILFGKYYRGLWT